jgi:two-component sensor histidine kinase
MPDRPHSLEDIAFSLTLAVVTASPAPLLLLDGRLTVVAASLSFCDVFGLDPAEVVGRPLYALDAGDWDSPGLRTLVDAAVAGQATTEARDIDLKRPRQPVRHLIIQARRLVYLDLEQTRILIGVTDVTDTMADAAQQEALLEENSVLLSEVRHRVANSLQIIASVLLQNARKTSSEETRGNLKDAHGRVMAVAALERLLSTSQGGDVDVRVYFNSLCQSIAASMIGDPEQITLTVEGDHGMVEARVSVSLGLIVTELVINALKHAFPDDARGRIAVDYDFHGPNWVLCVQDDGVGMPPADQARTGIGASIVQALAGQLGATVEVTPRRPGTQVSIHRTGLALVEDDPDTAEAARDDVRGGGRHRRTEERS